MSWRDIARHRTTVRTTARTVIVLLAVLGSLALAAPALAAPAAPAHDEEQHTWAAGTTTVCVESHVGKDWDVERTLQRWNRLDGAPMFVLRDDCADYVGSVTVRYKFDHSIYSGRTVWFWDDDAHIVHADVTVNPQRVKAYARGDYQCLRSWTTTHEFGHVLGLRHYPRSHAGSVMSYRGWERGCGRLSAHDRADYAELYLTPTP
jgi:hypothetical protein